MHESNWPALFNNLLNVVQVVVLAYIAAKYRSNGNSSEKPDKS